MRLGGTYGLRDGALDLGGELHLDRAASQLVPTERLPELVAPWVRLLDPLFQRGEESAGTVVPITISGTRSSPRFRVEVAELKPDCYAVPGVWGGTAEGPVTDDATPAGGMPRPKPYFADRRQSDERVRMMRLPRRMAGLDIATSPSELVPTRSKLFSGSST